MNKSIISTTTALLLASSGAFAVPINPDGVGGDPTIQVDALGWNNGNAISLGVGSQQGIEDALNSQDPFQTFTMGALANFNDPNNNAIGGTNLNSTYEWTFSAGFQEVVTSIVGTTPSGVATFQTRAGGINYFNIYYDASRNADNLTGQGFADGTLILSGTILPFDAASGVGATTFSATGLGGALDQNGANNYPAITTVAGVGTTQFAVEVNSYDPDYFTDPTNLIVTLNLNTFQNLPYNQVNPSSCFPTVGAAGTIDGAGPITGGTPAQEAVECAAASIGNVNGVDGPNIMFSTRATNNFETVPVPAPGSLVLVGIGLAGLGIRRQRRIA